MRPTGGCVAMGTRTNSTAVRIAVRHAGPALAIAAMLLAAGVHAQERPRVLPETRVTASRLGEGVTGASTTVITAEDIERSPAQTLQDLLSTQPGIQVQNLYGGVNGTNATVDLRGFGAAATPNTLVLVNGRRLNDVDLAGVDFGAIPRASIERIEITRGNSGAVLYGDGAVGGVINIITRNGFNEKPGSRAEVALGTFRQAEASASTSQRVGEGAFSLHAGSIDSDGYRVNNELRQRSVVGELRRSIADGELYLNISADTQHLGLPGARLVTTTSSEIAADRRGSSTPFDFADKQGVNLALGGTRMVADGVELVLDGGVRRKLQQSAFFSAFGAAFNTYTETVLTTFSLTPRANVDHRIFGLQGKAIAGLDLQRSFYDSNRMVNDGDAPAHRYELGQTSVAAYMQETLALRADTDLSFGLRLQNATVTAEDRFDAAAPSTGSTLQGRPFDRSETNHAWHVGLEHRLDPSLALFGRAGRSFRMPNVDERVGSAPFGTQVDFALKTQTSMDAEIGFRRRWGGFGLQVSGFAMELRDEIHYDPTSFINTNLDPTRRMGVEGAANWSVTDALRLRSSLAYTDARFREGKWRGNEVPLVSRVTGSAGVSWDIAGKLATLDAGVRRVGDRRFDSDQANFQPMIPGHTLVDLRLGGELGWANWSLAAANLLDVKYFDYGIASTGTYGRYTAYPLPGRTLMARIGARF